MTVYRGAQLGMSSTAESPYGTAATIDRWMPYTDFSGDIQPVDGESDVMDAGAVARSDSNYRAVKTGAITYSGELKASGFGKHLKAAFGAAVSTLVSTGLYQQNFTLGAGPLFDANSWQACRPMTDGTFENDTYLGAVVKSIEFKMDKAGVLTVTTEMIVRDMVTNIAKASLSRVTTNRFTFGGFTAFTGTYTAHTTVALPSAITALTDVKSWSVKIENQIVEEDYRSDGTGLISQPAVLQRKVTGSFEAAFTPAIQALRTNYLNNTLFPLVAKFVAGSTDAAVFGFPAIRITDPPTPNMDGQQPTATFNYEVLNNGVAAEPMVLSMRTADSAL